MLHAHNRSTKLVSLTSLIERLLPRVSTGLFLGLGLVCSLATSALAQQAQSVKSGQAIVCDGKNYQLRLLTAATPVGALPAKVLGIVLTPEGATDSKVFGVYWIGPGNTPTHRDDTSGVLSTKLVSYGNGTTADGKPATESFFSSLKCSPDQQVTAVQGLLKNISSAPALSQVVQSLQEKGVAVEASQITDASAGQQDLFRDRRAGIDLATAVRQYVTNLLTAEGRNDAAGGKPSLADENKRLTSRIKDLEKDLTELRDKNASFFGGTPTWLLILFAINVVLLLIIILYILIVYLSDKKRAQPKTGVPPQPGHEGSDPQAAQISPRFKEILDAASTRAREIEADTSAISGAQNITDILHHKLTTNNILHKQESKRAKRMIDEVLAEAPTVKWRDALNELLNQLEDFQMTFWSAGNPPSTLPLTPSPASIGVAKVVPETQPQLHKLETEINALKSSVDGFELKLKESFESARAVQNIWSRYYEKDYSGGRLDQLVIDLGELINLHRFLRGRCCRDGASATVVRRNFELGVADLEFIRKNYLATWLPDSSLLHEITDRIKTKIADDIQVVDKYKKIEASLRDHFSRDVKADDAVTRIINERLEACDKLGTYRSANFTETINAVVSDYKAVAEAVNRAVPTAKGTIIEMVASLATEYLILKPEAEKAQRLQTERDFLRDELTTARLQLEAGKKLVGEIALQLNFKNDHSSEDYEGAISGTLNKLTKERESSVYSQLRLGLSSALAALQKATGPNGSSERTEVIEALQLERVKKGIRELLSDIEECSGEQLWTIALAEGFSQKWLHYLIRADLLLRTYYTHQRDFGFLQHAVSLACSSALVALHELQVEVVEVGLFEPLPREMETEPVYPGIRNLPAVREKVRFNLQHIQTGELVVDVTSFPYFVKGIQENRGRAALANPSAWLQH